MRLMRKDMTLVEKAVHFHQDEACDYCTNPKLIKVTISPMRYYWKLCYDCALEHAERFDLVVEKIHEIAKKYGVKLSEE